MEIEGWVVNNPPLFKGEKYELWKLKIVTFLEFNNIELLEIIEVEIPTLVDATCKLLPRHAWSEDQRYTYMCSF